MEIRIIKKILIYLLLALLSFNASQITGLTGRELLEQVKLYNRTRFILIKAVLLTQKRVNGEWKTLKNRTMIIKSILDKKNKMKKKIIISENNINLYSLVFMEQHNNVDDLLYSYSILRNKYNRILNSNLQNDFADTDFSYEDLIGLKLKNYKIKKRKNTLYRGEQCFVISVYGIKLSKYYMYKLWITKKHFIPIKVEYYGKDKKLVKRMYQTRIKKVSTIFIPMYKKIINIIKRTRTIFKISQISTNIKFKQTIFQLTN